MDEETLNQMYRLEKEIKELREAIIILWDNNRNVKAQKLIEKIRSDLPLH